MLTEKFLTSGILVHQAEDDADLLIVNTAIRNTDDNIQVVVIGEDIDLLILLLTLSPPKNTIIFEKPGRGKIETRSIVVFLARFHYYHLRYVWLVMLQNYDLCLLYFWLILVIFIVWFINYFYSTLVYCSV